MATRSKSQAASIKRQTQQVMRNYNRIAKQTIPAKIERALFAVGVSVANKSLEYTPLEYSMLQNSNYHIVEDKTNGWRAVVGFTQEYAAPLHERTDWNPRPPDQKAGPAWNPNATPKFLTRAANEQKTEITQILTGDLRL